MRRILVTGASGFVGSAVVRRIRAQGHHAFACTARPAQLEQRTRGADGGALTVLPASPSTDELSDAACDSAIQLAWYAVPADYLTSIRNADCAAQTVVFAQQLKSAGCEHVVAAGTCFEYAFTDQPLREDMPVAPQTLYAAAKHGTHGMLRALLRDSPTALTWARLFYLYGPWEAGGRLVPSLARALIDGRSVDMTHGRQIRDYLHVDDAADALLAAALSPPDSAVGGQRVLNIASGAGVTVRAIAESVESSGLQRGLLRFGAVQPRAGDPEFIVADASALRDGLGWEPRFTLDDGIAQTVSWWRAAGDHATTA